MRYLPAFLLITLLVVTPRIEASDTQASAFGINVDVLIASGNLPSDDIARPDVHNLKVLFSGRDNEYLLRDDELVDDQATVAKDLFTMLSASRKKEAKMESPNIVVSSSPLLVSLRGYVHALYIPNSDDSLLYVSARLVTGLAKVRRQDTENYRRLLTKISRYLEIRCPERCDAVRDKSYPVWKISRLNMESEQDKELLELFEFGLIAAYETKPFVFSWMLQAPYWDRLANLDKDELDLLSKVLPNTSAIRFINMDLRALSSSKEFLEASRANAVATLTVEKLIQVKREMVAALGFRPLNTELATLTAEEERALISGGASTLSKLSRLSEEKVANLTGGVISQTRARALIDAASTSWLPRGLVHQLRAAPNKNARDQGFNVQIGGDSYVTSGPPSVVSQLIGNLHYGDVPSSFLEAIPPFSSGTSSLVSEEIIKGYQSLLPSNLISRRLQNYYVPTSGNNVLSVVDEYIRQHGLPPYPIARRYSVASHHKDVLEPALSQTAFDHYTQLRSWFDDSSNFQALIDSREAAVDAMFDDFEGQVEAHYHLGRDVINSALLVLWKHWNKDPAYPEMVDLAGGDYRPVHPRMKDHEASWSVPSEELVQQSASYLKKNCQDPNVDLPGNWCRRTKNFLGRVPVACKDESGIACFDNELMSYARFQKAQWYEPDDILNFYITSVFISITIGGDTGTPPANDYSPGADQAYTGSVALTLAGDTGGADKRKAFAYSSHYLGARTMFYIWLNNYTASLHNVENQWQRLQTWYAESIQLAEQARAAAQVESRRELDERIEQIKQALDTAIRQLDVQRFPRYSEVGQGWLLSFPKMRVLDAPGGAVQYSIATNGDFKIVEFNENNQFHLRESKAVLHKKDVGFLLSFSDVSYTFDPEGVLTSIATLGHAGSIDVITKVIPLSPAIYGRTSARVIGELRHSAGGSSKFYYDESGLGLLRRIGNPDGTFVEYKYSSDSTGNTIPVLRKVIYPGGANIKYDYQPSVTAEIDGQPFAQIALTSVTYPSKGKQMYEYSSGSQRIVSLNEYSDMLEIIPRPLEFLSAPELAVSYAIDDSLAQSAGGISNYICYSRESVFRKVEGESDLINGSGYAEIEKTISAEMIHQHKGITWEFDTFENAGGERYTQVDTYSVVPDDEYKNPHHCYLLTTLKRRDKFFDAQFGNLSKHITRMGSGGASIVYTAEYSGPEKYFGLPSRQTWETSSGQTLQRRTIKYHPDFWSVPIRIASPSYSIEMLYGAYSPDDPGGSYQPTEIRRVAGTGETISWKYKYDSIGRLTSFEDGEGNTATIIHSTGSKTVVQPHGDRELRSVFDINELGRVTKYTNPLGHVEEYDYDHEGRLLSRKKASGATGIYSYDLQNNSVTAQFDPNTRVTIRGDRFFRIRDFFATNRSGSPEPKVTTEISYDYSGRSNGRCLRPDNGIARCIAWHRDVFGRLLEKDSLFGGSTSWAYFDELHPLSNFDSRVVSRVVESDSLHRQSELRVDPLGRTVYRSTVTDYVDGTGPDASINEIRWFDIDGLLRSIRLVNGKSVLFAYDGFGRLARQIDAGGYSTHFAYDDNDNLTERVDEEGYSTRFTYDDLRRLIQIDHPTLDGTPAVSRIDYDDLGRVISERINDATVRTHTYAITPQEHQEFLTGLNAPTLFSGAPKVDVFHLVHSSVPTIDGYDAQGRLVARSIDGHLAFWRRNSRGIVVASKTLGGSKTEYVLDSFGDVVESVKPNGGKIELRRNNFGLVEAQRNSNGEVTQFSYDDFGRMTSLRRPLGNVYSFQYAPQNFLTKLTTPAGDSFEHGLQYSPLRHEFFRWPSGQEIASSFDARDLLVHRDVAGQAVWQYRYDGVGNLVEQTNPLGGKQRWTYDGRQRPITASLGTTIIGSWDYGAGMGPTAFTDASGNITRISRDNFDRPTSYIWPDGSVAKLTYNDAGGIEKVAQGADRVTKYQYTPDGTINKIIFPEEYGLIAFDVDVMGLITKVVDEEGVPTQFEYDLESRLVKATDRHRVSRKLRYDANGNLAAVFWPQSGKSYRWSYDSNDRVASFTTLTEAGPYTLSVARDDDGRLESISDGQASTSFSYSAAGLTLKTIDRNNNAIQLNRNALGQITDISVGGALMEEFVYDKFGRLLARVDSGGTEGFKYDDAGRLRLITDATGNLTTKIEYDSMNRVVRQTYPGGYVVERKYDGVGNTSRIGDSTGQYAEFAYDLRNRLIEEATNRRSVFLRYSPNGKVLQVKSDPDIDVHYRYDPANDLIESVESPSGRVIAKMTYDGARLDKRMIGSGVSEKFEYTVDGLLKSMIVMGSQNPVSMAYQHDLRGNIVGRKASFLGETHYFTYQYDNNDQLKHFSSNYDTSISYDYDERGNVREMTENGALTSLSYDRSNRLVSYADIVGPSTVEYDSNGRVLAVRSALGDLREAYSYSATGLLKSSWSNLRGRNDYDYDILGRLITVRSNSKRTDIDYLGANAISIKSRKDGQDALTTLVAPTSDPDDLSIRLQVEDTGSLPTSLHQDAVMTAVATADAIGDLQDISGIAPFGHLDETSDIDPPAHLLHGHLTSDGNLYWYRSRWLHSGFSRFLAPDPIGGSIYTSQGTNRYVGFNNNPLSTRDPYGLQSSEGMVWVYRFLGDDSAPWFSGTLGVDRNVPQYDSVAHSASTHVYGEVAQEYFPYISTSLPNISSPWEFGDVPFANLPPIPAPVYADTLTPQLTGGSEFSLDDIDWWSSSSGEFLSGYVEGIKETTVQMGAELGNFGVDILTGLAVRLFGDAETVELWETGAGLRSHLSPLASDLVHHADASQLTEAVSHLPEQWDVAMQEAARAAYEGDFYESGQYFSKPVFDLAVAAQLASATVSGGGAAVRGLSRRAGLGSARGFGSAPRSVPSPSQQVVTQTPSRVVTARVRYTPAMATDPYAANFARASIEWVQEAPGNLLRVGSRSPLDAAARAAARRAMDSAGVSRAGLHAMHPVDSIINPYFLPETGAFYFGSGSVNMSLGAQLGRQLANLPPGTFVRVIFEGFPSYSAYPAFAPQLPPSLPVTPLVP